MIVSDKERETQLLELAISENLSGRKRNLWKNLNRDNDTLNKEANFYRDIRSQLNNSVKSRSYHLEEKVIKELRALNQEASKEDFYLSIRSMFFRLSLPAMSISFFFVANNLLSSKNHSLDLTDRILGLPDVTTQLGLFL